MTSRAYLWSVINRKALGTGNAIVFLFISENTKMFGIYII